MEYTILILILPFLSFLILGLAGMRMKNSVAGAIGFPTSPPFTISQAAVRQQAPSPPSCPTTLNGCRSQPTFISIWAFCSILFPS
mgnify:CR=1 FL=1